MLQMQYEAFGCWGAEIAAKGALLNMQQTGAMLGLQQLLQMRHGHAGIATKRKPCCDCNNTRANAVNASMGIWRNNMRVSVSVCCKTSNHCFGFVSSCFDVSSHETTLDKSVSAGAFNTLSTSL